MSERKHRDYTPPPKRCFRPLLEEGKTGLKSDPSPALEQQLFDEMEGGGAGDCELMCGDGKNAGPPVQRLSTFSSYTMCMAAVRQVRGWGGVARSSRSNITSRPHTAQESERALYADPLPPHGGQGGEGG